MRISDWSSDVCSSDLRSRGREPACRARHRAARPPDCRGRTDAGFQCCQRCEIMSDAVHSASLSSGRRRAMLRTAMGPGIAAALSDPAVIEIMVNPDGVLRLDRLGEGRIDTGMRYDPAPAARLIRLVARTRPTTAHRK